MLDDLSLQQLDANVEEREGEALTPEMIAQRETALRRIFWMILILCLVVLGVVIWEVVDLIGAF